MQVRKEQSYSFWASPTGKGDQNEKKKDPGPNKKKVFILHFSLKLEIEEIFYERLWL